MSMSFFTDELSEVKTHKKEFLGQMNHLIPWGEWVAMIKPCYYKGERGNKPYDLELMLRIYVLQMVYNVADMAVAAEVIDSRAFSEFCGVTSSNQVPNGDTIGRFRNILIQHQMQEKLFDDVVNWLKSRGLMLMKGTIVDSTLIATPSSTKNAKKERDPDAHQVKKGNQWYFDYKGHIGVDKDTGLVNKLQTTAANVHDVTKVAELMLDKINLTLDWAIQQVSAKDAYLPSAVQKLLSVMEYDVPYTAAQLMSMLELKSRVNFRKNYLDPALEHRLIVMGIPDKPTSRNQTYIRK